MKKHSIKFLFFFTAIALTFTACKSEEELTLAFSPQLSKKYEISMNYVQDMEMGEMGNMKNTIVMTYDLFIKEKDKDQNTVILTTFKKVGFDTKSPQGNVSYDSDVKTEPTDMGSAMMSKIFGSMIGQSFSMTVDKEGKVINLTGMETIFNNMIKNLGLDTIPGGAESIAGFKEQFSDEQFKKNFGESFNILPTKGVKIGDTWDITTSSDMMGMEMKSKNTYTLKGVEGDLAIVDVISDFNMDKENSGEGDDMKMDGSQTGTLKIDINTGMAVEGDIKQTINTSQKMMGQEIPMKINGTVNITSKEIK